MTIYRTSHKNLHPKGEASIPRALITVVDIRKAGTKGRMIGTVVPLAAGVAVGLGIAAAGGPGIVSGEALGAVVGALIGIPGSIAGFFIGRAVDRKFTTYQIVASGGASPPAFAPAPSVAPASHVP